MNEPTDFEIERHKICEFMNDTFLKECQIFGEFINPLTDRYVYVCWFFDPSPSAYLVTHNSEGKPFIISSVILVVHDV